MSLVELCDEGDLEGVKAALKRGDDVNTKGDYGNTGLMGAVIYNHNSVVDLLLSTPNIDVNLKDNIGGTGLMYAVSFQHNSVVTLLLNTPNIDVNQKNNKGKCALHWAVEYKNSEALKLLLNVPSIDVNIVDNNGYSAVHWAVYENNMEVESNIEGLKLLLSHPSLTSLTLNQKDNENGDTPVMLAMKKNGVMSHVVVEMLAADPRVDLDTTDKKGRSLTYWEYEILSQW